MSNVWEHRQAPSVAEEGRERRGSAARADPSRPSLLPLVLVFIVLVTISVWAFQRHADPGVTAWYTTVVWTLPILLTAQGLAGGVLSVRRASTRRPSYRADDVVHDPLLVVVPTIGRHDTVGALERALGSFSRYLMPWFSELRIDVVVEEGCDAIDRILDLVEMHPTARTVIVPRDYRTPGGTRFKARANQYANELRRAEGQATDDVWVLHMDDDTGVGQDTAEAVAAFIHTQQTAGESRLDLAQGVLSYPRELAPNRLIWLADAVRPGCDVSIFAAATGTGTPRAGLHGELLLVRASTEAEIGWDYGPRAIVEDAEFATRFSNRFAGRSGWFPARSYGASPSTLADFVRQRERWVWGLLELVTNASLPLRGRLLLMLNVAVWSTTPFQHPLFVLLIGLLVADLNTAPIAAVLLPVWSLNMAFLVWLYWEGLKINANASSHSHRMWWEPVALITLIPVFALMEATGIFLGLVRFVRRSESSFTVIVKPL